ncbi:hypothetical protein F4808DRAFT_444656 [Astrocystis sublimbata]|nr:hypothetical protein F4808DRAFT_444656 [Astrocystis sublimbata]
MDDNSDPEQPTGYVSDFSDLSDEEPLPPRFKPPPYRNDITFTTVGSADMAHVTDIDRNDYTDDDIKIVYEIVVRAETILAEELTPSSRLPTHALFLAYDEISAEYELDPSERHISKLVFMVGGVKGQKSLMEKFKAVMARMHITLDIEETQPVGSEYEYPQSQNGTDAVDHRMLDDGYTSAAESDKAEEADGYGDGDESHYAPVQAAPDVSPEQSDKARERHLADKATAFRQRHHTQFLALTNLRRWQNTARRVDYLSAQSDATRDAELREALENQMHTWRAIAAESARAAPHNVHPNAYSKRTERIAIRTHEIILAKKCLIKWRQSLYNTQRKRRDASLLAEQLARREYHDDDFKENPQLARLAQRAHRNLVLSRAFTSWSNRAEQEGAKAEAAAKAYEMSLKSRALGLARNRSVIDGMRKALASKIASSSERPAAQAAPAETEQSEPPAPAPAPTVTKPAAAAPIPSRPRLPPQRPLSSAAIAEQLQARKPPKVQPTSVTARPSSVIPIAPVSPDPPAPESKSSEPQNSPPVSDKPVPIEEPGDDTDADSDDLLDARTMLARRHILRMRYFGAWERYTSEHVARAHDFGEDRRNQQLLLSLDTWRDEAFVRPYQAVECEIEFRNYRTYRRVADIIPQWRERAAREWHHRKTVLGPYAEQAEYYSRTTQALPVLRGRAEQASEREQLLRVYAERTNYYMRGTQALETWRERADEAAQKRQLHEGYAERADYYYRVSNTLTAWQHHTKERRKQMLREAHLETRRTVKRGMGERAVREWRDQLEPRYVRFDFMNRALEEALEHREWRLTSQAFASWRFRAWERADAIGTGEAMLKQKAVHQWQDRGVLHRRLQAEASDHWAMKAMAQTLKDWNRGSLQIANRPEMVANALEKKERKLLRQRFETWYGRTADKLVPVELPDGTYQNVGQLVQGARQHAVEEQARGFLATWRAAAASAVDDDDNNDNNNNLNLQPNNNRTSRMQVVPENAYASASTSTPGRSRSQPQMPNPTPTPNLSQGVTPIRGRPMFLRPNWAATTTPLAPPPSHPRWQGRDSTMGRSEYGGRPVGRSERKNPKNLRVSWAA